MSFRTCTVFYKKIAAGILEECADGYKFCYLAEYCNNKDAVAISLTLPLQKEPFISATMFSFFDGLIPEGWLLDVTIDTWKIDVRDRFGLLVAVCRDCIGAVSVIGDTKS